MVYRLKFNARGKANQFYAVDKLPNLDLLEHFTNFCNLSVGLKRIGSGQRFLTISSCDTDSSVGASLVRLESGNGGLEVRVLSLEDASEKFNYGSDSVGMTPSRVFLYREPGYKVAYLCIEHVKNGAGDTIIPTEFKKYLREVEPDVTLSFDLEMEEEAIKAFRGVQSFEIKKTMRASDVADGFENERGTLSFKWNHSRGKKISWFIYNLIRSNPDELYSILHIPQLRDLNDKLSVTLETNEGNTRTFMLDEKVMLPVREILNEAGSRPLTDHDFKSRCLALCKSISERTGRNPD